MANKLIRIFLLLYAALFPVLLLAQQCNPSQTATTPTQRFIDRADGTVKDRVTGLLWQRCAMGQSWDGDTCKNDKSKQVRSWFSWDSARSQVKHLQKNKLYTGWRLPTLDELATIIEKRCQDPTINLQVFPNAPAWVFWTSDELLSNNEYVWRIDFKTGKKGSDLKSNFSYHLRLVKGEMFAFKTQNKENNSLDLSAWDDGIHDLKNPDITTLQTISLATKGFPNDSRDQVDWAKALLDKAINPRTSLDGKSNMQVWDNDIIFTETQTMPHVSFPHKLHSMWLSCENCHNEIFKASKKTSDISMQSIYDGKDCGVCHGKVAFHPNSCERCHSVLHPGSPIKWW
jgi:c(7)-type cytochrome triheme protein